MTGTFLYLATRSMRNRAARRLQRLRQPRYLAGLAVGLVYLYFAFLRNQLRAARRGADLFADADFVNALPQILTAGALVAWLAVLVAWFWPSTEPPIKFTGAEVQFFYTAPVTRRQILHYKLLRSQLNVVMGVLVAAVFSGAATAAVSGQWTFLVGGLVLFSTLRLHLLGIGLTRASFTDATGHVPLRGWIPPLLMAVLSAVLIAPLLVHGRELAGLGLSGAMAAVVRLAGSPPSSVALWPFAAVLAPIVSPPGGAFARALLPALGLLALNYWWVLQSDAVLEEAAMAGEKQKSSGTRRLPAPVARKAPFHLAPSGRPELALLWKNLILLGRYASPRTGLRLLLPIVLITVVAARSQAALPLAQVALIFAAFFTLLGPYMIRNDLRHDLPRLAILKTWPVRGWSLLVGELLAPAAVLTLLAWLSLAVALALSGRALPGAGSVALRLVLAAVAALLAPVLIAAQLLIQNGAVLLFPGWIPTGGRRPRGIEAMGQQMLMLAGTLLALLIGVLPAAAVSAGVGFALYQFVGVGGLLPAGLLLVVVLLLEAAVVVALLGRLLERTDPAQVEAEEGN